MLPSLHDVVQYVPLGVALGAMYGVSGVGIVVLYRTTGVLNLAYGAIGALGAFLAWELINNTSWCPDWLAYVTCVAFGGVASLVYGLVFGPVFAARDPLVKATATLGVPVRRVEASAWFVSGLICGTVGLLLPSLLYSLDAVALTFFVISVLAAALIARLQSLWVTLFAALAIGIVESCLSAFATWPTQEQPLSQYRAMTPFVLAIVALLVLGRRRELTLSRADH